MWTWTTVTRRPTLALAIVLVCSLAVACNSGNDEAAERGASGQRGDPGCDETLGQPVVPDGPAADAVVLRDGEDLRVEAVVHPRPEDGGEPWSQWGQGIVLADGRFLSAAGDHRGEDGNSYLYVYDPERGRLTQFADVLSNVEHEPGDWGYGKIHAQMVGDPCEEIFVTTYWGTRRDIEFGGTYSGDVLLRLDPTTLEIDPLGVPVEHHGVPSLASDPETGVIYGEATDPLSSTDDDAGAFFAYDPADGEVITRLDDDRLSGFRNIMVAADGRVFLAGPGDQLLVFEPGTEQLTVHDERLPGDMLRASTSPGPDGSVYGVTDEPPRFFALRPDGSIDDLGEARGYTTSMALHPDGERFFSVPEAHGDAFREGAPVIEVDTASGDQRVVAELNPLVDEEFGLTLGGSYNVAVDPSGERLFVGFNAGSTRDDPWGEVVLVALEGSEILGDAMASGDAAGLAGCWGASVPGVGQGEAEGGPRLADVTENEGLIGPLGGMHGHAIATGDANGDGWTDVFVGSFADRPASEYRLRGASGPAPDRLLLGGPDGFEVDETFPEVHGRTSGAAFADLDGDGQLDLVVARNVRDGPRAEEPTVVLRNDGGEFSRAAELDSQRSARSIGILDYDADGLDDIFLVEDRWGDGSSALFRNTGDFAFDDVTEDAGIGDDVHGLGVAATDLTGDGRPDLFVSGSNRLFVNTGDGFEEADAEVFEWDSYGPEDDVAGVAVGDVDRDGRPDLLVGQHYGSTVDDGREVPVRLYLNRGTDEQDHPRFEDVTEEAGLVGLQTKAPHVEIVDLDGDGVADILTSASAEDGTRPAVFRGIGVEDGIPRFEPPDGLGDEQYWVTGATFDADRDGRLDVMLVEWEPARPSLLLAGDGAAGHWLEVQVGPNGAGGTGSIVEVFEDGGLGDASQLLGSRAITHSTGYGAGAEPVARFGLGEETAVDLRIRRPDGDTDLEDVDVDQRVSIEGPCT